MQKLYKRIAGVLHYHEAWADKKEVTEHWGIVGEKGETKISCPKKAIRKPP